MPRNRLFLLYFSTRYYFITPEQGYGAYRYQLCEADAWDYGSTFADMILSLLF